MSEARPTPCCGVVCLRGDEVLLIRRGKPPRQGQWSIPGGTLELGESLQAGVARELLEETGLHVRVLDLIEVFDRIYVQPAEGGGGTARRPRFHYVIVDYLCERISGEARAGSDVTDVAFACEDELENYHLTETAMRVLRRAFAMAGERQKTG